MLRRSGPLAPGVTALIEAAHNWVVSAKAPDPGSAEALLRQCRAVMPKLQPASSWTDLVTISLISRLTDLIGSWQDCLEIVAKVRDPSHVMSLQLPATPTAGAAKPLHVDPGIAAFSGFVAVFATITVAIFWIATAWPQGGLAAAFAAVLCSLFANLDDPTPAMRRLTLAIVILQPIIGFYLFEILPFVNGFGVLALSLAPLLLPLGILMGLPKYSQIGFMAIVGVCILTGLQVSYASDFATYVNTNVAFVAGCLAALAITMLSRLYAEPLAVRRLFNAGLRDLAGLSRGTLHSNNAAWASLTLDRVGLLFPRLAGGQRTATSSNSSWRSTTSESASRSSSCRRCATG